MMRRSLASIFLIAAMIVPVAAMAATPCPERVLDDGCCERQQTPDATIAGLCCCTIRELPGAVSIIDSPALAPDSHDGPTAPAPTTAPSWLQPAPAATDSRLPASARAPPAPTLLSLHTSLIC